MVESSCEEVTEDNTGMEWDKITEERGAEDKRGGGRKEWREP